MAAKKNAAATEDAPKSKCPITKEVFLAKAKPLSIKIGEETRVGEVKEFSSGSFGFYSGDKIVIDIDGVPVRCQVTCSIVVVGSKPAE